MTRINTNVASLIGRNTLDRSNASLNEALTRLSTGLRINTGKDDPAGLIASENLRSDITSIRRAISNTDRANQVIATADSALGQVSSLLNDIRGLVTESANAGALSQEQIDANQLQVDSSLEALNRIAQTTTFQGRRLLDGSLDFVTTAEGEFGRLSNLQIDQANLGATGSVDVDINVTAAATQASLDITGIASGVSPVNSSGSVTFSDSAIGATGSAVFERQVTAAQAGAGTVNLTIETADSTEAQGTIDLTATTESFAISVDNGEGLDGTLGNGITVNLSSDGAFGASLTGSVITVNGVTAANTVSEIEGAINALDEFTVADSGSVTTIDAADIAAGAGEAAGGDTSTGAGAVVGVDATTEARTINIGSVAGANQDFNIVIDSSLAASSISDFDAGDGITAGLTGDASTGYTVFVANDGATNLNAIASFIQSNISEAATATYSGAGAETLDPTRGSEAPPSVPTAVTGSQAAVTATETIDIAVANTEGAAGNLTIDFQLAAVANPGATTALIDNGNGNFTVVIDSNETDVDFTDIRDELNNIAGVTATYGGGSSFDTAVDTASQGNTTLVGGRDAGDDVISVTAAAAGSQFDGTLTFNTGNSAIGGIDVSVLDGDITVSVDSSTSYSIADISAAINDLADFNASVSTSNGSGTFDNNDVNDNTTPVTSDLTGGQAASGGIAADAVIELAGINGSEVFSLQAGTGVSDLIKQINLVSDATGVQASQSGTTLQLRSTEYGSNALVDLQIQQEADGGTFRQAVGEGERAVGTNVAATVNGVAASSNGNQLSINTATLDLTTSVEANFIGTIEFEITGGGALFQLGPDVVSNQQARLGISSVNTAALGGTSGNLFQLQSGGSSDLTRDTTTAARIVEEAIDQITGLRGRLGAFQRTTLETNQNALNDTLVNLTEAESSIRDADFAVESARLTRAQILVQSGTNVLSIANQNPQNVLALLR